MPTLVKPFVIFNKISPQKRKIIENRKKEVKTILSNVKDISSKEIERSKSLWDQHKNFFIETLDTEIVPTPHHHPRPR
jgi:hypothetical protein